MFIELTRAVGGPKILVNTNKIISIRTDDYHTVVSTDNGYWEVEESYEELKELLFA